MKYIKAHVEITDIPDRDAYSKAKDSLIGKTGYFDGHTNNGTCYSGYFTPDDNVTVNGKILSLITFFKVNLRIITEK